MWCSWTGHESDALLTLSAGNRIQLERFFVNSFLTGARSAVMQLRLIFGLIHGKSGSYAPKQSKSAVRA